MSDLLPFILRTLRPMLGDVKVTVHRDAQLISIERTGEKKVYTYDQIADEIEKLFGQQ